MIAGREIYYFIHLKFRSYLLYEQSTCLMLPKDCGKAKYAVKLHTRILFFKSD